MTIEIAIRLTASDVAALDSAIARGRFATRSEALRAGLDRILFEERQREIDETYVAGYAKQPRKAWVGELGLAGLAAFDEAEGGSRSSSC